MTTTQPAQNGGKRPGAGRPMAEETIAVPVRLTARQAATLRRLGVAAWLRPLLDSLADEVDR